MSSLLNVVAPLIMFVNKKNLTEKNKKTLKTKKETKKRGKMRERK